MKRRIKKKKISLRIYHINKELANNAYLIDKYKDDATIRGMIIRVAIPFSSAKLKLNRNFLIRKLERGDY